MEERRRSLFRETKRFLIVLIGFIVTMPILLYLKSQNLLDINLFFIEAIYIVLLFINFYRAIRAYKTTAVEAILKHLEHNVLLNLSQSSEYLLPLYVMDKVSKSLNNQNKLCYMLVTQHILNGIYSAILVSESTFNKAVIGNMYYFCENTNNTYPGLNARQKKVFGNIVYSIHSEINKPDFLRLFDFLDALGD